MNGFEIVYQMAKMLPEEECKLLYDKLGQDFKNFNIDELISDDHQKLIEKREMIEFLIRTQFSKFKNS